MKTVKSTSSKYTRRIYRDSPKEQSIPRLEVRHIIQSVPGKFKNSKQKTTEKQTGLYKSTVVLSYQHRQISPEELRPALSCRRVIVENG